MLFIAIKPFQLKKHKYMQKYWNFSKVEFSCQCVAVAGPNLYSVKIKIFLKSGKFHFSLLKLIKFVGF
jgi:hypothetical protein